MGACSGRDARQKADRKTAEKITCHSELGETRGTRESAGPDTDRLFRRIDTSIDKIGNAKLDPLRCNHMCDKTGYAADAEFPPVATGKDQLGRVATTVGEPILGKFSLGCNSAHSCIPEGHDKVNRRKSAKGGNADENTHQGRDHGSNPSTGRDVCSGVGHTMVSGGEIYRPDATEETGHPGSQERLPNWLGRGEDRQNETRSMDSGSKKWLFIPRGVAMVGNNEWRNGIHGFEPIGIQQMAGKTSRHHEPLHTSQCTHVCRVGVVGTGRSGDGAACIRDVNPVLHTAGDLDLDSEYDKSGRTTAVKAIHDRPFWASKLEAGFRMYDYAEGWLTGITGTRCPRTCYDGTISGIRMEPVNMELLVGSYPNLRTNMRWIADPNFVIQVINNSPQEDESGIGAKNVQLKPHTERMLELGFAEPSPRSTTNRFMHSAFLIPKSTPGQLRFILNCKTINELTAYTSLPPCRLPSYETIVETLLPRRYACEFDFTSYFFQFPIPERIRPLFSFRVDKKIYRMTRLPMGYRGAPQLAQAVLLNLIEDAIDGRDVSGIGWIDNAIFAADDIQVLQSVRDRFRTLCLKYSITIGAVTEPNTYIITLGIEADLTRKCWKLKEKWVKAVAEPGKMILDSRVNLRRSYWKISGIILWRRHALRLRLHEATELLMGMSELMQEGDPKSKVFWNTAVKISEEYMNSLRLEFRELVKNEWVRWNKRSYETEMTFVSDASTKAWAFVVGNSYRRGRFPRDIVNMGIFEKEFFAVVKAIEYVVTELKLQSCRVTGHVDNKGVIGSLHRGYSLQQNVQPMLRTIHRLLDRSSSVLHVEYVASEDNIADKHTRLEDEAY